MSANGEASYDARRYRICPPWFGEKGPAFERIFGPNFIAGLGSQTDKFSSLEQHMMGLDPGSVRPPTADELAANPLHVNAVNPHPGGAGSTLRYESEAAWKTRENACVAYIRTHVENSSIRKDIDRVKAKHLSSAPDRVFTTPN